MSCLKIAVLGQPNVGKSTFINALLGRYVSEIANWPGVTVDIKVLKISFEGKEVCLHDFPGMYSLSGFSEEEKIAAKVFIEEDFYNNILVADAAAVRRTLYLVVQALELKGKGVIALNKYDEAEKFGIHINASALSKRLGFPVILTSVYNMIGIEDVLKETLKPQRPNYLEIDYGDLEIYIEKMAEFFKGKVKGNPKWYAVEYFIGNPVVMEKVEELGIKEEAEKIAREASKELGEDLAKLAISKRWEFIDKILEGIVEKEKIVKESAFAELLDKLFVKPVIGQLLSLSIIFLILLTAFTINTGFPLDMVLEAVGLKGAAEFLDQYNLSSLLSSVFDELARLSSSLPPPLGPVLSEGVIPGVGAVLSFFPLIFTIYFFMALLEDSGLAPRIAVSMDPLFKPVGLTGKAVFPMIIGMGCNVPAVLSSRVMESPKLRKAVALNIMYVPCQARLVVFLALASLLPKYLQAISVFSVYIYSLLVFLVMTKLTLLLVFKSKDKEELILELPPYHIPKLKIVMWITWDQSKHFLKKAGTIIFAMSLVMWFLLNTGPSEGVTWGQLIGHYLAPIAELTLDLKGKAADIVSFAMIAGTVAKELVLDTVAISSGVSDVMKAFKVVLGLTPAQAIGLMYAIAVYLPCIATLAMMLSEVEDKRLVTLSTVASIILSIISGAIAYRISSMLLG